MIEALLFRLRADSVGLTLGPHKVRFELADPTHQVSPARLQSNLPHRSASGPATPLYFLPLRTPIFWLLVRSLVLRRPRSIP